MSWPDDGRVPLGLDALAQDLREAEHGRVPVHDDLVHQQPVGWPRLGGPGEAPVDHVDRRLYHSWHGGS